MSDRYPRVTRGAGEDYSEELREAAGKIKKVKKKIDKKADDYLAGNYDPKKGILKKVAKGAAGVVVLASLLTGATFNDAAEINSEQEALNYKPAPIVMDVSEYVNTPVEDDDDGDAEEQKGSKLSPAARFRQAILQLPQSVRLLIITPLWALGTAIMTAISFLWNILFASPLAAFIASFAFGFAILTGLFTATAKILFPDIPLNKILCKKNVLILGCLALLLSGIDAVAPLYWNKYPLAAALVKLVLGGSVIGVLSVHTHRALEKIKGAISF